VVPRIAAASTSSRKPICRPTSGWGHRTFQRFGQSGASKVLTWCPTCTKNFDELEKDVEEPSFDMGHVSEFLATKSRFAEGALHGGPAEAAAS
jgi:hypothetical protein